MKYLPTLLASCLLQKIISIKEHNCFFQLHWTNPELKTDYIDGSGMTFFYEHTKRQYHASDGIMGRSLLVKFILSKNNVSFSLTHIYFDCGDCSQGHCCLAPLGGAAINKLV